MDEWMLADEALTLSKSVTIASLAVGLVFGYAAVMKLLDAPRFVAGLGAYPAIPDRLSSPAAGLLISAELLIAWAHLTGFALRFVMPGTIALLAIFLVMMTGILRRGENRPCLCFGAGRDDRVDRYSLARVAVLLSVELALYARMIVNETPTVGPAVGVTGSIELLALAALATMLAGWCFALPKVLRAWRVVRS